MADKSFKHVSADPQDNLTTMQEAIHGANVDLIRIACALEEMGARFIDTQEGEELEGSSFILEVASKRLRAIGDALVSAHEGVSHE